MLIRFLALFLGLTLLAACETPPTDSDAVGGAGGSGYGSGADGSGNYAPGTQDDLANNIGDRVFFATDSSSLSSEAQGMLQRQANWLQQYPNVNVAIEGHADERGTRAYNLALGERRATAARNYLVSLGVNPSRVSSVSYGKERPAALGSSESAWAQNRRAVTVISY